MKKLERILFFGTLCLTPFMLSAAQYAGLHLGCNEPYRTDGTNRGEKTGYTFGVVYGYSFDSGIRSEMEMSYRENHRRTQYVVTSDDQVTSKTYRDCHSLAYMANVCYEVGGLTTYGITPYLGAGIGYCSSAEKNKIKTDAKTSEDKLKDNRLAYQAIVGMKRQVADGIFATLQYKYFIGRQHAKDHSAELAFVKNF